MKSVQIQSFLWSVFSCIRTEYSEFSPNTGKHRPEKYPYLDTFHEMKVMRLRRTIPDQSFPICITFTLQSPNFVHSKVSRHYHFFQRKLYRQKCMALVKGNDSGGVNLRKIMIHLSYQTAVL